MAKTSSCGNSSWIVDTDTFTVNSSPIAPTTLTQPSDACEGASYTFTWNTTAGHTYDVQYTTQAGDWTTPIPVSVANDNTTGSCFC